MAISSIIGWLVLVFGILSLIGLVFIAAMVFKLNIQFAATNDTLGKMETKVDTIVKDVNALNQMTMDPMAGMDGQFITGGSIQEIMEKMNNLPPSVNPHDVDALKKYFQDLLDNENNNRDDDEPDEKWNK